MPQTEHERAQAYRIVLATSQGQTVLIDLVKFSQQNGVSEGVALGRADVVNRFLLMQEKAGEPKPEEPQRMYPEEPV